MESGDYRANPVIGGIVFQSRIEENEDFRYKIRLGVNGEYEIEYRTAKLFSEQIVDPGADFDSCSYQNSRSYPDDCVENRYKELVMLQGLVDSAYIRVITGDNTILPTSNEDLCKTDMVRLNQILVRVIS